MKTVAVLGAGFVSKPAVDYFIERCGYRVIVTSLNQPEAERLVRGRSAGTSLAFSIDRTDLLERIVTSVDLVMSMIPPSMHLPVANACVKHRKPMVTTSYISPEMDALDDVCRERGILILNEIGEDPGLDIMGAKRLIDGVKATGGTVTRVLSYGAGLPALEHNDNPMGYKFSWRPKGVILAAQAPAAYLVDGTVVQVPGGELCRHRRQVDLEGLGTFEAYPNRDCTAYLHSFDLAGDVSFFRGILRYVGWCETMGGLAAMGLLDDTAERDVSGTTYAGFTAALIGSDSTEGIVGKTAHFLGIESTSDVIRRLAWLGFFDERPMRMTTGTNADILVDMMLRKMSYAPQEKDMVIVHNEITAQFGQKEEKRVSTLLVKGQPGGDSAMSRSVSLPAAIASRLILDGRITATGVQRPTLPAIYQPVLDAMADLGYRFKETTTQGE